MLLFMPQLDSLSNALPTMFDQLLVALKFIKLSLQPRSAQTAENLSPPSNWLGIWSSRSTGDSTEVPFGNSQTPMTRRLRQPASEFLATMDSH